jgi:hypothetical protein
MSKVDIKCWGELFPWLSFEYHLKPKVKFADLDQTLEEFSSSEISISPESKTAFLMVVLSDVPNDFVRPSNLKRLTLGEMFYTIPEQAVISGSDSPDLSNPSRNLLLRHGWSTFIEFSSRYPSEIAELPGGGKKFLKEMLLTLMYEAANWFHKQVELGLTDELSPAELFSESLLDTSGHDSNGKKIDFSFRPAGNAEFTRELNRFLFKAHLVKPGAKFVSELLSDGSLMQLQTQALSDVDLEKWFSSVEFPSIQVLMADFLETLDDKEKTILLVRSPIEQQITLDEIGEGFGLTRERVRQLEGNGRKDFKVFVYSHEVLSAYYEVFLQSFEGFAYLQTLLNDYPFLENLVPGTELRVIDLFVHLNGDLHTFDGLVAYLPRTKFTKQLKEFLDDISNDEETHSISYFQSKFQEKWPKLNNYEIEDILRGQGFTQVLDFWLHSRSSGIQDIAVALLAHHNRSMTPEEILSLSGRDRSLNSLRNALLSDNRIQRTSLSKFGLTSWGLPTYTTISEVIGEYIDQKGSTHIEQLVNFLTETFEVADGSVRTYANSYPFETVNGYVKRTNIKSKAKKPVYNVKKIFRTSDSWLIRVEVTGETLRGSGTQMPAALGEALGISNKESKAFTGPQGELKVTYPSLNLTISSLRELCLEAKAIEGDFVFIEFKDSNFEFWKADLGSSSPRVKILELAGFRRPDANVDLFQELCSRIDLPEASSLKDLTNAFEKRKEKEILKLMKSDPNLFD